MALNTSSLNKQHDKKRFRLHGVGQTGMQSFFARHVQAGLFSLGRMFEKPLQALLTITVIGISLSLPAVAYVVHSKVEVIASDWSTVSVSVFCDPSVENPEAKALAAELQAREDILAVRFITKEKAREDFRLRSGFGEAAELVSEDIFPATLVVEPAIQSPTVEQLNLLAASLREYQAVDIVQLDQSWLKKLKYWLDLIELVVALFALLLSVAVIVIVGNTIRLEINNRKDEIEVIKLVGATNAFVRRPFLYMGIWQGFAGSVLTLFVVLIALMFIGQYLDVLAMEYNKSVELGWLELGQLLLILLVGIVVGWLGSWLAVGQHLRRIEPS